MKEFRRTDPSDWIDDIMLIYALVASVAAVGVVVFAWVRL